MPSNSLEIASTLPRSENLSSAIVSEYLVRILSGQGQLSSDSLVFYIHRPDVRDEVIGDIHLEFLGEEFDVVSCPRVEQEY